MHGNQQSTHVQSFSFKWNSHASKDASKAQFVLVCSVEVRNKKAPTNLKSARQPWAEKRCDINTSEWKPNWMCTCEQQWWWGSLSLLPERSYRLQKQWSGDSGILLWTHRKHKKKSLLVWEYLWSPAYYLQMHNMCEWIDQAEKNSCCSEQQDQGDDREAETSEVNELLHTWPPAVLHHMLDESS